MKVYFLCTWMAVALSTSALHAVHFEDEGADSTSSVRTTSLESLFSNLSRPNRQRLIDAINNKNNSKVERYQAAHELVQHLTSTSLPDAIQGVDEEALALLKASLQVKGSPLKTVRAWAFGKKLDGIPLSSGDPKIYASQALLKKLSSDELIKWIHRDFPKAGNLESLATRYFGKIFDENAGVKPSAEKAFSELIGTLDNEELLALHKKSIESGLDSQNELKNKYWDLISLCTKEAVQMRGLTPKTDARREWTLWKNDSNRKDSFRNSFRTAYESTQKNIQEFWQNVKSGNTGALSQWDGESASRFLDNLIDTDSHEWALSLGKAFRKDGYLTLDRVSLGISDDSNHVKIWVGDKDETLFGALKALHEKQSLGESVSNDENFFERNNTPSFFDFALTRESRRPATEEVYAKRDGDRLEFAAYHGNERPYEAETPQKPKVEEAQIAQARGGGSSISGKVDQARESLDSSARQIYANRCSQCHSGGDAPPFSIDSIDSPTLSSLKSHMIRGSMPPSGSISTSERQTLINWANQKLTGQ